MKLAKETLSQINRSELREDINDAKKPIEKTWNEKCKIRNDLFCWYLGNKKLEELYNCENLKQNLCIQSMHDKLQW